MDVSVVYPCDLLADQELLLAAAAQHLGSIRGHITRPGKDSKFNTQFILKCITKYIYVYGSCESEYIHIYIHLHCGVVRYKTFFCLLKQEQVMPFKGGLVGFRILHLETTLSLCVNYYICRIYIIDIYKIYNYMPIKNITLTSSLCPSQERV